MIPFRQSIENAPKELLECDANDHSISFQQFKLEPYEYDVDEAKKIVEEYEGDSIVEPHDATSFYGLPIGWLDVFENKMKVNAGIIKIAKTTFAMLPSSNPIISAFLSVASIYIKQLDNCITQLMRKETSLAQKKENAEKYVKLVDAIISATPKIGISSPLISLKELENKSDIQSFLKNIEYIESVTKCMQSIVKQFKIVNQVFLRVKDLPHYYTVYELQSEDGAKNRSCVVCFGMMFAQIESWLFPGAGKERIQFFTRNAPLFKKLVDNFSEDADFSQTQFLVASTSGSFLNIPVMHDGILLTEDSGTEQFYKDVFAFVDNLMMQFFNVQYLDIQRTEAKFLNAKEEMANFYTRDKMMTYIIGVNEIKDVELREELLTAQAAKRHLLLWDNSGTYAEEGEIEELSHLMNTDWEEEGSSVVKVLYRYLWNNGTEELCASIGKQDVKSLFDNFDEYELEYRMPTLYKAYINGIMGRFSEGALIQTTKVTYFKYVYQQKDDRKRDEILNNVDTACMRILRELTKYCDYIKKRSDKESDKRAESNSDGLLRLFAMSFLS